MPPEKGRGTLCSTSEAPRIKKHITAGNAWERSQARVNRIYFRLSDLSAYVAGLRLSWSNSFIHVCMPSINLPHMAWRLRL